MTFQKNRNSADTEFSEVTALILSEVDDNQLCPGKKIGNFSQLRSVLLSASSLAKI